MHITLPGRTVQGARSSEWWRQEHEAANGRLDRPNTRMAAVIERNKPLKGNAESRRAGRFHKGRVTGTRMLPFATEGVRDCALRGLLPSRSSISDLGSSEVSLISPTVCTGSTSRKGVDGSNVEAERILALPTPTTTIPDRRRPCLANLWDVSLAHESAHLQSAAW